MSVKPGEVKPDVGVLRVEKSIFLSDTVLILLDGIVHILLLSLLSLMEPTNVNIVDLSVK